MIIFRSSPIYFLFLSVRLNVSRWGNCPTMSLALQRTRIGFVATLVFVQRALLRANNGTSELWYLPWPGFAAMLQGLTHCPRWYKQQRVQLLSSHLLFNTSLWSVLKMVLYFCFLYEELLKSRLMTFLLSI